MESGREAVFRYVKEKYGTVPDYPWDSSPDAAVLRKKSGKWYGLVMSVKKSIFFHGEEGSGDIINLKCSPLVREVLIGEGKAFPAYHMNKRLWVSVPLYGSITREELFGAVSDSYDMIK